ncbi:hypothetical protein IV203_018628 [Nitzschia inconspicua]|uniref:Uncharacterized protein n=1 Tax=Nitzschia inconspicua TaxID=303405 RepID=A0A9K3M1Z8_9STRA|nr:hypothetical protein IV203_018628 [Nitzschia inconspicua]
MSSTSDHSIIFLNNQGARYIASVDYHSAIDCLSRALYSSRSCVHRPIANINQATLDISFLMEKGYNKMKTAMENEEQSVERETPSDFIYSSPIYVPESALLTPGLSTEVAISSIVIFNLALAHHLFAVQDQHQCPKQETMTLLAKSMKLYELAIELQQQDAILYTANYSSLFILSSLNNLRNVYRMLDNDNASQCCYQHLLSLLMYLNFHEGCFKTSKDYSAFFNNALQQSVGAAPAA